MTHEITGVTGPWAMGVQFRRDSTKKLVSTLTGDPIKVTAFFPDVNEVRGEVAGYLRELAAAGPKLQVDVVDRLLVPKVAKDLRVTQDGVIVLSRGSVTATLNVGTQLEQARPLFERAFADDPAWAELTRRLPAAGLLEQPVVDEILKR